MRRKLASLALASVLGLPIALGMAHATAAPAAAANYCTASSYDYLSGGRTVWTHGMFTCTFSFNKVDMITEIDKYNAQTGKWEYVGNGARWESYLSVTPTTEWNQLWFSHDFYVTGLRVRSMSWGAVLPVGSNQWYWSTVGYGLILVTQ